MTLITTTAEELAPPPLPSADDARVTPWRDAHGRLAALSHAIDGRLWLHVLGVASFRLDPPHDLVVAVASPDALPGAVEDEFRRTVRPLVLHLQGREVLHASAVRVGDGVVAFCAPSETGKSTLAYALARRGYGLWADDAVVFEIGGGTATALSLPFEVRLRRTSARHLAADEGEWRRDRLVLRADGTDDPRAIASIFLLARDDRPAGVPSVEVEPLPPALAAPALLEHAVFFGLHDRERKRRMMEAYLALADLVPVHRIAFRSGFRHLETVLDGVEHAVRTVGP